MPDEISNERLRLFVAIAIPEAVRNEMIAVQRELKPLALGDVRWTNAEQLHLTLKFLGNVPTGSLEAVKQSLAEACAGVRPFRLRAKGIGFFPNERQPRVIWAGFEDDENAPDRPAIARRAGAHAVCGETGVGEISCARDAGPVSEIPPDTKPKNSCRTRWRLPAMSSANGGWRTFVCSAASCHPTARGTPGLRFFRSVRLWRCETF